MGKFDAASSSLREENILYSESNNLMYRYEREEMWVLLVVVTIALGISCLLYRSMGDGWQERDETRWRVLGLSTALLFLSIAACVYLCHRLQPTVCFHSIRTVSLRSVNSQLHLLGRERPPSYDAVVCPPPTYNAIYNV